MERVPPAGLERWPTKVGVGVERSKALMVPSPKLPTRRSLENSPKLDGASARPLGASSGPPEAMVLIKLPLVSNSATRPRPRPGTSSCLAASCMA